MLHPSSMESAKHWELPGEELGTGTRRSENHLNGGIDCISSFVPHSNWGSKSTKFDDLLRERRSKSMLLKTLQDMSGRPPLIVYEQNTSPKASVHNSCLVPHLNDNSKPYLDQENLDDIIVYSHSLEVWNPEYSVARVAGKEAVRERGESDRTTSRRTSRRHQFGARGQQSLLQRRSSNFYECGGVGIFLLTVPMFRRTNATRGVLNRPAEDGRVHVVEPKAREALKKRGVDGRLYSKSMPELDSAKMIIDARSSSNIASIEMVDQLGLGNILDVEEEFIECYALIAKPTSKAEDRWDAVALRDKG
ncbi:hypothetical protein Tco_0563217 [Tanacetum coccineum]